jgi:hypothetical protein
LFGSRSPTRFYQGIIDAATGAKKVERIAEEPKLYNLLENLCISRGITMPCAAHHGNRCS